VFLTPIQCCSAKYTPGSTKTATPIAPAGFRGVVNDAIAFPPEQEKSLVAQREEGLPVVSKTLRTDSQVYSSSLAFSNQSTALPSIPRQCAPVVDLGKVPDLIFPCMPGLRSATR
jgi:hypothetical protein